MPSQRIIANYETVFIFLYIVFVVNFSHVMVDLIHLQNVHIFNNLFFIQCNYVDGSLTHNEITILKWCILYNCKKCLAFFSFKDSCYCPA